MALRHRALVRLTTFDLILEFPHGIRIAVEIALPESWLKPRLRTEFGYAALPDNQDPICGKRLRTQDEYGSFGENGVLPSSAMIRNLAGPLGVTSIDSTWYS